MGPSAYSYHNTHFIHLYTSTIYGGGNISGYQNLLPWTWTQIQTRTKKGVQILDLHPISFASGQVFQAFRVCCLGFATNMQSKGALVTLKARSYFVI